ncbi:DUF1294 domain-containing protein [Pseudolactococcus yaeyamensis]
MIKDVLIGLLILWNLVVFVLYAEDKRRAKRGLWRISEKTLLLTSLLFGGVGALVSAHIFHHKTRKIEFQLSWWLGAEIDIVTIFVILKKN